MALRAITGRAALARLLPVTRRESRLSVGQSVAPPRHQPTRRQLSGPADAFYTPLGSTGGPGAAGGEDDGGGTVVGEVLDHAVNLKRARPGDVIKVPYEVTVTSGMREFWQAAFYSHDRICTSTPFARALGLQDQALPFSLMLFLAGSMSHAEAAVVQVAYRNAKYLWPGFTGDTFTKTFQIKQVNNSSDGQKSAFDFVCRLVNQRGKTCFSCEKTMIFPFNVASGGESMWVSTPPVGQDSLRDHLIKRSEKLAELGGQSLKRLRPGMLVLHAASRPLSAGQSMALCSLGRLTHPRHFNSLKYGQDELLVPGGLVLGLASSLSARDLHEALHEELVECSFFNPFHPGDLMSSMSYVQRVDQHPNGVLERLTVRTVGLKGLDVDALKGLALPLELLTGNCRRTKEVERICRASCPQLSGKVVVLAERSIVRHAPKTDVFLL